MRPFSQVDIDDPDEDAGAVEAAEFYSRIDNEGGFAGLLQHSGAAYFPEPLRPLAHEADHALEVLKEAAQEWAAERGVEY